jgi:hypothetical protein
MAIVVKDGITYDLPDSQVEDAVARGYTPISAKTATKLEAEQDKRQQVISGADVGAFAEAAGAGLVDAAIAPAKAVAMGANAPGVVGAAIGRQIGHAYYNPSGDPRMTAALDAEMGKKRQADQTAIARQIMALTGSENLARDVGGFLTAEPSLTGGPIGAISGRQFMRDAGGIANSGGALGTADERAREYDAAARQRAIDAPGAALAGSVVGNVAGALVSGGGVSSLATKGSTLASRLGLMAVDGALGGIGAADENAWLQGQEKAKAEDVIASMGLGAVFGGAMGGLGEVGGSLWRKATAPRMGMAQDVATLAAGKSLSEAASEAAQPITDRAAKTLVTGTKALMGLTDEQAAAYERGLTSRAFREVVSDPTGTAQRAARELAAPLETIDRQVNQALQTFGEAKPHEVKRWLAQGGGADSATQLSSARTLGLRAADEIDGAIERIAGEETLQRFARDVPELLRKRVQAATTNEEAFLAIDQGKRELQKLVLGGREKLASGALSGSTRRDVVDALFGQRGVLEQVQEKLRTSLEDEATWGAAAVAQRERNAAAQQALGLKAEAEKLYKRTVSTDVLDSLARDEAARTGGEVGALQGRYATGRKKVGLVDEDTFSRNLMRSGSTDSRPADEIFDAYLRSVEQLGEAVAKHGGDVDATALSKATKDVASVRDGYLTSQRAWNALQEAQERGGSSYVQQVANAAPLLGAMVAGPAGAAVGGTLAVIARGATDPTGTIRAIAQIDKLTALVDNRLGTGVRDMLARKAPSAASAARPRGKVPVRGPAARAAAAGLVGYMTGDQTPSQAYAERAAQIEALTDDPERMALASAESLDGFAQRFPVLGGEVALKGSAALDFLRSKQPAPSTVETVFGGRQVVVTDREAAKWGRYWTATTDPLAVLDLARDGALEREHVEALQTLYPSLHAKLSATIVEQIKAGKVPYSARVQADALMGLNGAGEPSANPDAQLSRITAAQNMAAKPRPTRTPARLGSENKPPSANLWK